MKLYDSKVFEGPSQHSTGQTEGSLVTAEQKMRDFLASDERAQKESFEIKSMEASSYKDEDRCPNGSVVTIVLLFSWDSKEASRPSEEVRQRTSGFHPTAETTRFPSKAPLTRQPETPAVRISQMPQPRPTGHQVTM